MNRYEMTQWRTCPFKHFYVACSIQTKIALADLANGDLNLVIIVAILSVHRELIGKNPINDT